MTEYMKTCPDCAEDVRLAARVCRYCGYRFDEEMDPGEGEPSAVEIEVETEAEIETEDESQGWGFGGVFPLFMSWIFGLIGLFLAFGLLIYHPVGGLFGFISAALILPPTRYFAHKLTGKSLILAWRLPLSFVLLIIGFGISLSVELDGSDSAGMSLESKQETNRPKSSTAPRSKKSEEPLTNQVRTAIAKSDDFEAHGDVFVRATTELVQDGKCTLAELKEVGGWWKSQEHRDKPIYFTYCGGVENIDTRLYLDVSTGKVFR